MKGQILDIFPEGGTTFRACVLEVPSDEELIRVVDLNTGEISMRKSFECALPIIENIFDDF